MVTTLARLVGNREKRGPGCGPDPRLDEIALSAKGFRGARVFFEEWNEPLISGIRWVEELVLLAGASRFFPNCVAAANPKTGGRPSLVIARNRMSSLRPGAA